MNMHVTDKNGIRFTVTDANRTWIYKMIVEQTKKRVSWDS